MDTKLTIGITQSEARFENYLAWIGAENKNIELLTLSPEKQNSEDIKKCNAILLTGGVDVMPAFYHSQRMQYPNMPEQWNKERDLFEIKIFELAQEEKLPVLAVCRGLQLVNVFLGGTLVPDLEEAGKEDHRRKNDTDQIHSVTVVENTLLSSLTKPTGEVNSAHHQAIDEVGGSLIINCYSTDGVIEGIEWKDAQGKPPLLGVQWHPERMQDKEHNPFSENIRNWFLTEAKK